MSFVHKDTRIQIRQFYFSNISHKKASFNTAKFIRLVKHVKWQYTFGRKLLKTIDNQIGAEYFRICFNFGLKKLMAWNALLHTNITQMLLHLTILVQI